MEERVSEDIPYHVDIEVMVPWLVGSVEALWQLNGYFFYCGGHGWHVDTRGLLDHGGWWGATARIRGLDAN